MSFKGLFANKSGINQLIIFLLLVLTGWVIISIFTFIVLLATGSTQFDIFARPEILKWAQLLSAMGVFLFPALLAAYLFSNQPENYLQIKNLPTLKSLAWVVLFMFLLSPIVNLTALLNKEIVLPSFLEGLEQWMQQKEIEAERLTELMLSGKGISNLLMNLLVVAIAAGINEEFFFRGTLQRIFERFTSNYHIIIWTVAFIFGAIHLQFYGLLPRMLLGAFFGYLLYWTKNLWLPVFAHFLNNAFGVIALSQEEWKNNEFINGEINSSGMLLFYLAWGIISSVLLYFCINRFRKEYN